MMKIQMQEKKIRLPEDIHAYASKKVTKLERYFREEAEAFITFSVEKNRNNVELTVHAANTYFRASESTSNMYASIDAAVSTIERQIRKNKPAWSAVCGRMPLPERSTCPIRLCPSSRRRKNSASCVPSASP